VELNSTSAPAPASPTPPADPASLSPAPAPSEVQGQAQSDSSTAPAAAQQLATAPAAGPAAVLPSLPPQQLSATLRRPSSAPAAAPKPGAPRQLAPAAAAGKASAPAAVPPGEGMTPAGPPAPAAKPLRGAAAVSPSGPTAKAAPPSSSSTVAAARPAPFTSVRQPTTAKTGVPRVPTAPATKGHTRPTAAGKPMAPPGKPAVLARMPVTPSGKSVAARSSTAPALTRQGSVPPAAKPRQATGAAGRRLQQVWGLIGGLLPLPTITTETTEPAPTDEAAQPSAEDTDPGSSPVPGSSSTQPSPAPTSPGVDQPPLSAQVAGPVGLPPSVGAELAPGDGDQAGAGDWEASTDATSDEAVFAAYAGQLLQMRGFYGRWGAGASVLLLHAPRPLSCCPCPHLHERPTPSCGSQGCPVCAFSASPSRPLIVLAPCLSPAPSRTRRRYAYAFFVTMPDGSMQRRSGSLVFPRRGSTKVVLTVPAPANEP
jgi:hypothetical protein